MTKTKQIIFYVMFFLFCLGYSATAEGYDYDFWARLVAGIGFVQTGQVLKHDFLSYTPTHLWFDHEWGSGVIFYLTQHFFNSAGILILQTLLVFSVFFIITKIIDLRGVKTTSAYNFLFYFFALHAVSVNFNEPIRCQMFSYLFFALFLYILERARRNSQEFFYKPLIALPFLMIIWNNLHGGCVSGIGLIIIYIIGEALNRAPVKQYILTLIPTVLVLLINPWGFSYMSFLLDATTMSRPNIMEWWGLFSNYYMFRFIHFKIFALVLILTELWFVAKSFSLKKLDKTKFLLLAVTLYLAIKHVKMVPFFAIAGSCFIYDDFYTLLNVLILKIRSILRIPPKMFGENFVLKKEIVVYSIILIFALSTIKTASFSPIVRGSRYPHQEIEFIKINKLDGKLFINFGLGSFTAYKLYPQNKIFMDGRYEEVYYDYMMPIYSQFYYSKDNNIELFKKFPPDVMVIEKFYPVYKRLKSEHDWKLVFEGKAYGVFVPFKSAKKTYLQPSKDVKYYKKTLFDTNIKFKK